MPAIVLILIVPSNINSMDQDSTDTPRTLKKRIADLPEEEQYDYAMKLTAFRNILLQKHPRHLGTHTIPQVLPLRQPPVNILRPALLPPIPSLAPEYPTTIQEENIQHTKRRASTRTKNTRQGYSRKQQKIKKRRNRNE